MSSNVTSILDRKRLFGNAFHTIEEVSPRKARKISDLTSEAMEVEEVGDSCSRHSFSDLPDFSPSKSFAFQRPVPKLPLKQLQNQEISLAQAVVCRNFAKKVVPIYSEWSRRAQERADSSCSKQQKKDFLKRACRYEDNCAKAERLKRGAELKITELSQYDHINRSPEKLY